MDATALLRAYDEQLRTDAETPSAITETSLGPLRLVDFAGGRGFVTYRDLGGADEDQVRRLVGATRGYFEAEASITRVEWKTRGHDDAPGLHDALIAFGFEPGEPESIMVGEAGSLVADIPLPAGVTIRQVRDEHDVRAMCAMQDRAFGDDASEHYADAILRRLARDDGMELWVAEADRVIVAAGRLEPVAGTDFAGIWGGATLAEWRGKGIYRALTSARARSALARGKSLMHSDSTEFSRPILEQSGLVKVSTTTPYLWRRSDVAA
jgi:GNAT superfamily N-acetyltransferase